MPKVVTSEGVLDFVQSGKHEVIPAGKPSAEPPKEAPKTDAEAKPEKAETKDDDEIPTLSENSRKYVDKQHRLRKEAQEAAAEAERFAENQYNRARLAEERAAELDRQLKERLEAEKPKPEEAKKPVHDEKNADGSPKWYDEKGQFKAFEYAEALSAYSAAKAVADDRAKQAEEAKKAEAAAAEEVAKARVAESRKLHADYDEVMANVDVKTHSSVLQYMTASEHIGEIAYYLAKNPDYVERINKLNPLKAIAEIGKLELTFEKPKPEVKEPPAPPPKAGAPAPIQPLNTSGAGIVQTDPSKMSFRELREYERQRGRRH